MVVTQLSTKSRSKLSSSETNGDDSEIQHQQPPPGSRTENRAMSRTRLLATNVAPRDYYQWSRQRNGLPGEALEFDGNDDFAELLVQQIILLTVLLWKYHDKGTEPGDTWLETNFDDSSWEQGPTQLGYGNDGEKIILDTGQALLKRSQLFQASPELEAGRELSSCPPVFSSYDAMLLLFSFEWPRAFPADNSNLLRERRLQNL